MDADIPGAISISAANSPILPIKTPPSPGVIVRSTMVMRRVRRWDHFRVGPVRSGLRICREISGNGAAISLSNTNRRRRLIRTDPRAEPNAFIAVAVGNRASPVCARPLAAPTSRISPATISVSESSANANPEGSRLLKRKTRLSAAFSKSIWNTGLRPVRHTGLEPCVPVLSDLAVRIEPKLCSASLGVGFGFAPALLIWCLKRAQAPHFIEDAFRVQLAFQPFERAIHWFAFSNNDFWHQFTSIPKNSPISTWANAIYSGRPRRVKWSGKGLSGRPTEEIQPLYLPSIRAICG